MPTPVDPIKPPDDKPIQPPPAPSGGKVSPSKAKYVSSQDSPFAKMFSSSGAKLTFKQFRALMNGILKTQIAEVKKNLAQEKKSLEKLKKIIEGREDD